MGQQHKGAVFSVLFLHFILTKCYKVKPKTMQLSVVFPIAQNNAKKHLHFQNRYDTIERHQKDKCAQETDTMEQPKYYIVERSLLPEVFLKVAAANFALRSGQCHTAGEAAASVGLSRSTFYKYKDGVKPFLEIATDRIVTFQFMVSDIPGVLSRILERFAQAGANLLTVNQGVPVNGQASVSIAARTGQMRETVEGLAESVRVMEGILSMEILACE